MALGQVFPRVLRFPLSGLFHRCSITCRNEKTDHLSLHLHHKVTQQALRLRCVCSFCLKKLQVGRSGVRIPAGTRYFIFPKIVQTSSEVLPPSLPFSEFHLVPGCTSTPPTYLNCLERGKFLSLWNPKIYCTDCTGPCSETN